MLPNNLLTVAPVKSAFRAPFDDPYLPLEQHVLGGTAIGNGANGRQVQKWSIFYEAGVLKVAPESGAVAFTLAVAGVLTCSLAFDSNMQVAIGYMKADGAHLYYYDSVGGAYTTLSVPGATSCIAATDLTENVMSAVSDVIFTYELGGFVYWRMQRDRYTTERLVGPSQGLTILKCAPSVLNRLQWQLGKYTPF